MSQSASPATGTDNRSVSHPTPTPPASSVPSRMLVEHSSDSASFRAVTLGTPLETIHSIDNDASTSVSARKQAQPISVSMRPRSGSNASAHAPTSRIRTSLSSVRGSKAVPDDEEANLTSNGDEGEGRRRRRSSIVDRIRDGLPATRERVSSVGSEPAAYEIMRRSQDGGDEHGRELNDEVVGMLDVIDPEVSTVNHLQNVTNGIFLPHFPALWSRRPEIKLGNEDSGDSNRAPRHEASDSEPISPRKRSSTVAGLYPSASDRRPSFPRSSMRQSDPNSIPRMGSRTQSKTGTPAESPSGQYPPKVVELDRTNSQRSDASDHSLDAHVRQVLHESKREKIKKGLRGLWVFLKTPMGFATGIYGILVVFWGAAIVFFLAGWIPTSDKWWQDRWVEISSQIVNGLFTITGVGLIPWRVQDTYLIWTLRQRLHRLRKAQGLPPVADPNDIEDVKDQEDYVSVLSDKERASLKYQQEMFAKSQTWYRPHATSTHRAFPMSWALWNTILMDLNSAFQCILCGCMWGLSQYKRPAWTTGSLIPLSFLCGIGAGVCIWQGSARTKKRETVTDKLRQALGVPLAMAPGAIPPPLNGKPGGAPLIDAKAAQKSSESVSSTSAPTPTTGETQGYATGSNETKEQPTVLEEMEDTMRQAGGTSTRSTRDT